MPLPLPPNHSCLLFDVDGSLIDIAPRPEEVVVPPRLIEDLALVEQHLKGAVALVSGRSVAQLDALFAPLRLRASGVHGAQLRFEPDEAVTEVADPIPVPVRDAIADLLRDFPGTFMEDKRYSLALHYRAAAEAGPKLNQAVTAILDRHRTANLHVLPGHFVIELKRPSFDKGVAIRRFLAHPRFAGRTPVFVGDDVTDHPGFAAAVEAGGVAYGVGQDIPGTTGTFDSPSAVRAWIREIAAREGLPA